MSTDYFKSSPKNWSDGPVQDLTSKSKVSAFAAHCKMEISTPNMLYFQK
jgi:hypothetical protein